MKLSRHAGTPEERIMRGLQDNGLLGHFRNRRPFTRPALDNWQVRLQIGISTRPAKPTPKVKEKRLINGKWTRDYRLDGE